MFTDRFEIQKKDYSYSAQVNFAECREKVKIDPNATVCVDFMKEEQEKKAVKTAESPHTVAQSTQQDSAKPTLSPRETREQGESVQFRKCKGILSRNGRIWYRAERARNGREQRNQANKYF